MMIFILCVTAAWVMGATFVMAMVTFWKRWESTVRLNKLLLIIGCLVVGWMLLLFEALEWLTESPKQ